jgi:hypothetical protein
MKSRRRVWAVLCGALLASLSVPGTAAQDRARFRGMDRNRDGVISRDEWRGDDQSFREHDRNGDGVLTPEELRQAVGTTGRSATVVPDFSAVDRDGNGEITAQEWMAVFSQLDTNRDGLITQDELGPGGAPADTESVAFRSGRERGLTDGRRAGREDRDRATWDLEGQQELERADAGYRADLGPLAQYQAGYREGFRKAYAEAYGPRR